MIRIVEYVREKKYDEAIYIEDSNMVAAHDVKLVMRIDVR